MPRTSDPPRLERRPGFARLAVFASGDFACNLYWQSVSLFLLFFYTDVLGLPPALAGLLYMAAALWDGIADLIVGIAAQRSALPYRRFVAYGSAPLGIAFALMFLPISSAAPVFAAQIVFRTLYAIVNIPYAAWSTRISAHSRDRTNLAGLRMLFGAAAAMVVALGTPWIGDMVAGRANSAPGFLAAAVVFACVGVPMLVMVATAAPEAVLVPDARASHSITACARALATNRAFVTLNLAAMASAAAATMLNQSVLYYFTHVVGVGRAGPRVLAMMGLAGAIAVPFWMAAAARIGARAIWFVAAAAGTGCMVIFAVAAGDTVSGAAVFLTGMQVALTGFNLAFWALLPDTVEYGEQAGGVRVEAMAFGVAALLQKVALAAGSGVLGLFYARIDYAGGTHAGPAVAAGIRWLMLAGPATALVVSALFIAANPLKRGVHAAIVARLGGAPTPPS